MVNSRGKGPFFTHKICFSCGRQFYFTHTHTNARKHTHARTHARTHALTNSCTHARTHTHTHTILFCLCWDSQFRNPKHILKQSRGKARAWGRGAGWNLHKGWIFITCRCFHYAVLCQFTVHKFTSYALFICCIPQHKLLGTLV
jgi:hypothetical protein